jgi:hypothetical protein
MSASTRASASGFHQKTGQRAARLHPLDLLLQQLAVHRDLAELRLQLSDPGLDNFQ